MNEINNFRIGIRDGIAIGIGYFTVSFAFGITAVSMGISWLEALLISAFNMTSAGQLAAVPIIVGAGGFFELALTQLVINLRYSLMSISLSQKLSPSVKLHDRFLMAFGNTDEIFAVSYSKGRPIGRRYFFALMIPPYLGWTLGTLSGALAGGVLPAIVNAALGVAIYAMLIAIVVPAARMDHNVAFAVIIAALLSVGFYFLPVLKEISSGFAIIIISVAVSLVFAILRPIPELKEDESDV